jgi:photosystem I subunit 8
MPFSGALLTRRHKAGLKTIYLLAKEISIMDGTYAASWLPWILIPVITWLMPVAVMGMLFFYIESDA